MLNKTGAELCVTDYDYVKRLTQIFCAKDEATRIIDERLKILSLRY